MDDIGLKLAARASRGSQRIGRLLVVGMPKVLRGLSVVGTAAMLWVGGGILVHGLAELGITQPEHLIHDVAEAAAGLLPAAADVVAWLVTAAGSGIVGLVAGAITAAVWAVVGAPFRKAKPETH